MDKNILIVVSQIKKGGAQRAALLYKNGFEALGYKVTMFSLAGGNTNYKEGIIYGNGRASTSWFQMIKVTRRLKPDLVLSTQNYLNLFVIVTTHLLGYDSKKLILREANAVSTYSQFMRLAIWLIYPTKSLSLAITESIAESLRVLGRKNVITLPNPEENNTIITSKFDLDNKRFIYVGRLKRSKRVPELVEFLELNEIECHFTIVGEGVDFEILKEKVNDYKYVRVELQGYKSNWSEIIEEDQCVLYNSRYEGYPNVLSECLSYGLPVVSSYFVGGGFEMLSKNYNGLFSFDFTVDSKEEFMIILGEVSKYKSKNNLIELRPTSIVKKLVDYEKNLNSDAN